MEIKYLYNSQIIIFSYQPIKQILIFTYITTGSCMYVISKIKKKMFVIFYAILQDDMCRPLLVLLPWNFILFVALENEFSR